MTIPTRLPKARRKQYTHRHAKKVITGFNTDIEHGGVIYHVQTEDKGVSTPLILSLVYNRGTILASKRSPYNDLLVPAFDEKALSERLQKQHKLICAAVRAGRIEDLKRMGKESAAPPKNNAAPVQQVKTPAPNKISNLQTAPPGKPQQTPPKVAAQEISIQDEANQIKPADLKTLPLEIETVKPKTSSIFDLPVRVVEDEPVIEAVAVIEDETILSAEAVAVIEDEIEINQTADDALKIELPAGTAFRSGERKTLNISVFRGARENPSNGAHIMIKVFGAAFRPLIFHAKTDRSGAATVHLQMPQFKGGRAAVLIKAMSDGEEIELRRVIERS